MAKRYLAPHKLGFAKAAAEAAVKQRKKSRKEIAMAPWTVVKDAGVELWRERFWFHPFRSIGIIVSIPQKMLSKIANERAKVRMANVNVAAMVREEMERDAAFKSTVQSAVKNHKWLYVDWKGRIVQTMTPPIKDSEEGFVLKNRAHPSSANMKEYAGKANMKYVNASTQPRKTSDPTGPRAIMVGTRGKNLHVSNLRAGKEEVITRTQMESQTTTPFGARPNTVLLRIKLKDGSIKKFVMEKDDAKGIVKRLGL